MGIFYSNELESMVSKAALDVMQKPVRDLRDGHFKPMDPTMLNARIAMYNSGVQALAVYLLNLIKQAEGNENHNDD